MDTENTATVEALTPETSAPVKRGRGRPPKAPADPNATPIPGDAAPPVKRGRPPKKAMFTDENIGDLAGQIQGLHMIAAEMTGVPIFALSEKESKMLAASVIKIAGEYNLAMSGKTGAMIQLIGVCAMIYVPRLIALKKMKAQATADLVGVENGSAPVN